MTEFTKFTEFVGTRWCKEAGSTFLRSVSRLGSTSCMIKSPDFVTRLSTFRPSTLSSVKRPKVESPDTTRGRDSRGNLTTVQVDAVAVLHRDCLAGLFLDDAEVGEFVHGDEGDGIAGGTCAAGSADAVDVVFW